MVIQRTLNKIEELKERPHADRHAIAFGGAVIVSLVLFVLWGFFAVRSISTKSAALTGPNPNLSQTAGAAAIQSGSADSEALSASSTDGYIDLFPSE